MRPLCNRCRSLFQFSRGLCIPCGEVRNDPNRVGLAESKVADLSDRLMPPEYECPVGSINVETTKFSPAASEVFSPEELEERICRHRLRIALAWPRQSDRPKWVDELLEAGRALAG